MPSAATPKPSDRQKRNIRLAKKRTTMVLEPYVWQCVDTIIDREGMTTDEFCQIVDDARIRSSLASATRMIALTYFRLLTNLHNPPFWDMDDSEVMPSSSHFAAPLSAQLKLPIMPLAIRRFVQEEERAL